MLHYESEASQQSIDLVQRILNGLDSVQHLLYFPSAAWSRCCVHYEALMRLLGAERKKAPPSQGESMETRIRSGLARFREEIRYLQPSASD